MDEADRGAPPERYRPIDGRVRRSGDGRHAQRYPHARGAPLLPPAALAAIRRQATPISLISDGTVLRENLRKCAKRGNGAARRCRRGVKTEQVFLLTCDTTRKRLLCQTGEKGHEKKLSLRLYCSPALFGAAAVEHCAHRFSHRLSRRARTSARTAARRQHAAEASREPSSAGTARRTHHHDPPRRGGFGDRPFTPRSSRSSHMTPTTGSAIECLKAHLQSIGSMEHVSFRSVF